MAKKRGMKIKEVEEGDIHTGSEAWNIAQYYTGYSIALPLRDLNDLEDIARFGSVRMDDDLVMGDDVIDKRRADSVKRYWQKLRQIVSDTLFKVKPNDRNRAQEILSDLQSLSEFFSGLLDVQTDSINHDNKIKVNEEFLKIFIDLLVNKKQEYLSILDRAGLIFREVEEVDLDRMMSEFTHGG